MLKTRYDAVIVGAGPAGIVAAIQTARAGASALLIEASGMAGGTMTSGGVTFPGLFHAWGRQVIAGIGWELVAACAAEADIPLPDFSKPALGGATSRQQVRVNAPLFAAMADEALRLSGADVLFHAMPAEVTSAGGEGWNVAVCTKTGLRRLVAKTLIDATGDAGVEQLAGLPVDYLDPLQPGTLIFHFGGYDPAALDWETLTPVFDKALQDGLFQARELGWASQSLAKVVRWRGTNAVHICDVDGTTSESRTQAEMAGRELMLRLYRFFRRQKGLERLTIETMAPEIGIRSSVCIRGRAKVTLEDYWSGRRWDDAVCNSFYPIDLHMSSGTGLDKRDLPAGVVPTIPRGAMLPEGSSFLIAPGRHLCGDALANSAYRVQATAMATGQAAGAMAALSARTGRSPGDLPLGDIHDLLREHGAIVP